MPREVDVSSINIPNSPETKKLINIIKNRIIIER